jgi:SAM-dependent MidA family methyltransferase
MRFKKYMENWLYGADGYYTNYREIGKNGDFYTAVSSSILFGGSIALEILKSIKNKKFSQNLTVCEIGAHHGYLIADIIQIIYTYEPDLIYLMRFVIIEKYKNLREAQTEYLKNAFGDQIKIEILESLDNLKSNEIFFVANEIFDAFPCDLIYQNKLAFFNKNKNIVEFLDISEINNIEDIRDFKEILEITTKYNFNRGEIASDYYNFAKTMQKSIISNGKADFITFDYGDLIHRNDFSVRVYQKHQTLPFFKIFQDSLNLNHFYKISDITFDVHFEFLRDSFILANWNFVDYKTQMKALVEFGITDLLEDILKKSNNQVYNSELNRAKILIDPAFMGERFKMMRFSINVL